MVYMSGSKMAREQSSIVNRTNVGGGPKKPGLSKGIANHYSSTSGLLYTRGVNTTVGMSLFPTTKNPVQYRRSSYYATHRGVG
jgi:hypothetical protein